MRRYSSYTKNNNYLTDSMFKKVPPKGMKMLKIMQHYLD